MTEDFWNNPDEPIRFWIGTNHCPECQKEYNWYYHTSDIFHLSSTWSRIHKRGKMGGWRPGERERGYRGPEIRWWINPHHCKACSASYDYDKNHNDIFAIGAQLRPAKQRTNYEENRERRRIALRLTCLRHYSGGVPECVCCQENEFEFLVLDHKGGWGNKHRRELGNSGLYEWIIKNNFPSGFQVLCNNCNEAIRYGRVCPHQRYSDGSS